MLPETKIEMLNSRPNLKRFWLADCCLVIAMGCFATIAVAENVRGDKARLTFEKDVAPILKVHCLKCHGGEKREAGLDVRRRFLLFGGGDSGAAIVSGQPKQSLLIEMIDEELMPPEGEPRLTKNKIEILQK